MSLAVYEELEQDGIINPNRLIKKICLNHNKDPNRGYGATARKIIREISAGGDWEKVAPAVFDGQGSMGNGAAMRVNPIGAYYFDDIEKVKELTILSAKVTHSSIEAASGAIAVAVATAMATKMGIEHIQLSPNDFINRIQLELPNSDTKYKIAKSKEIPYSYHVETIKSILGNGN
jgi:ADP-ribosylglycohydrolase